MIGRAAIGNPLLFRELNHYHRTGKKLEFDRKEAQKEILKEQSSLLSKPKKTTVKRKTKSTKK